jgi:enoyl-CoA hydratase/carnithine racemase
LTKKLLVTQRQRNVCTLILNRPEKKNSLSPELVEQLSQNLRKLSKDDSVRTVVIRGCGDQAFCSGYDIQSLPVGAGEETKAQLETVSLIESLFQNILNYPFPVIAMINGAAFGAGCELALCCDIRIAAANIRMGMPPAKLGLVYPWFGLQRFIQVVGLKNTKEMFFTGRAYEGLQLKELGLVNYLVAGEDLENYTNKMAAEITANAPLALKGTKRVLNLLLKSMTLKAKDLKEAESITTAAFLSDDLKEGRRAFLEKRKPQFIGK